MQVGFTGTRHGMTEDQMLALRGLLVRVGATSLHHGDCVGADAQAHEIAKGLGLALYGYPSTHRLRAYCTDWTGVAEPAAPMDRNAAIVASADVLIGCPEGPEVARSGTWATVRMARRAGIAHYVIYPDGRIE